MKTLLSKSNCFLLIGLSLSVLAGCDQLNIGGEKNKNRDSEAAQAETSNVSNRAGDKKTSPDPKTDTQPADSAAKPAAQKENKPQQQAGAQPLPPEVAVIEARPQTVTLTENLPARLEASREAVVHARVNGIVEKRLFTEGSMVKAGELLFTIDDAPYQANLSTAKAKLQQAEANRQLAQSTVNRYEPLMREKAISRQQYDQAKAEVLVAQANINAAKAAIEQAQINVDYAKVTAPIAGYVGKSLVNEGALVSAGQGTQMAKIQQLDPMYLSISQSASDVMSLKQAIEGGALSSTNGQAELEITFENGTLYPYKGKLLFTDRTVDEATGELLVHAEIPNPNNDLLPGLYVRVDMPLAAFKNAYLIPQQAVTRGAQNKDSVLVVNNDGTFGPRMVTVARAQGTSWIVTDGLQPGDKVLVEGQMRLRGATKVTPVPWEKDTNAQGTQAQSKQTKATNK